MRASLLTTLLILPLAGACAHVGEDEFESTVADLRREMADGDRAVEGRLDARIDALDDRVDGLETDFRALEEEFDVTVERLETALRVIPPVHFAFDDATIAPEYEPVLERFASVIGGHGGDAVVTVEGFTDPAGSAAYNERLGLRRAEAVRDFLLRSDRLDGTEVRTVSYGESRPRQVRPGAQGPGSAGWENRRVALVIDFAEMAPATVADAGPAPTAGAAER